MASKTWSMTTPADDVLKSAVPGLIRDVKEHVQIAGGFYAEQQTVPDQTIAIYAGVVFFQGVKVEYAGLDIVDLGTSGDFEVSALTADYYNKILFSIDSTGTLNATEGTEHSVLASVVEPTLPEGEFPICMVSVQDDGTGTAGTIEDIVQDDIQQIQGFSSIGSNISDTAYNESTWDGVTTIAPSKNSVRDEFETKQDTITGAATTIVSDDLTANRAVIVNGSGKVAASTSITVTELGYLNGRVGIGRMLQMVYVLDGGVSTGTTVMPTDNTIPQISEGDEYLSKVITPVSGSSLLKIDVTLNISHSSTAETLTVALFKNSTANALFATAAPVGTNNYPIPITFMFYVAAGSTSEATYRVRAGSSVSGTTTVNGLSGSRKYGGVMYSSLSITEYEAI